MLEISVIVLLLVLAVAPGSGGLHWPRQECRPPRSSRPPQDLPPCSDARSPQTDRRTSPIPESARAGSGEGGVMGNRLVDAPPNGLKEEVWPGWLSPFEGAEPSLVPVLGSWPTRAS